MAIKIEDYFKQKRGEHDRLIDESKRQKEALRKQIKLKINEKEALENEKQKKLALKSQVESEGMDTKTLDDKIREYDPLIGKVEAEILALQKTIDNHAAPPEVDFSRIELLMKALSKNGYQEGLEVNGIDEIVSSLQVSVIPEVESDYNRDNFRLAITKIGEPIKCWVAVDGNCRKSITIIPSGSRFVKGFIPQPMSWLPLPPTKAIPDSAPMKEQPLPNRLVFFNNASGKVFVGGKSLSWQEEDGYDSVNVNGGWEHRKKFKTVEANLFSDVAVSLEDMMEKWIAAEDGKLDLGKRYPNNPLLSHVQSKILEVTTAEPILKSSSDQLESSEIYKKIKADWDALIGAAWSASINGPMALLKYHLENGEKARFWCLDFENYYGFRLRTRDHDWIRGEIYINTEKMEETPKNRIQIYGQRFEGAARLGRMFFVVYREKN